MMTRNELRIGDRKVGTEHKAFLIAEAGVNHNGSLELARRMIDAAVGAEVDAVKFQTFNVADLILKNVEKAPYQKKTTGGSEDQFEMLEKLQIDENFHLELVNYCKQKGVLFLSTPYDEKSLDLLVRLDVPAIKIASTDTTNLLFLEKVAQTGKPLILSTGMSYLSEIEQAYRCVRSNGCHNLAILKCTSNYPTALGEVNLSAISSLSHIFADAVVGFSDHTEGVGASPYAVALGARIVEKHFTLDKRMAGPDHGASLSPEELHAWVEEIRRVEGMLGSRVIAPTESEREVKNSLQKCIVSKTDIEEGELLTRANLTAKRTGGRGISASFIHEVLGRRVNRSIDGNQVLHWQFLEHE